MEKQDELQKVALSDNPWSELSDQEGTTVLNKHLRTQLLEFQRKDKLEMECPNQ